MYKELQAYLYIKHAPVGFNKIISPNVWQRQYSWILRTTILCSIFPLEMKKGMQGSKFRQRKRKIWIPEHSQQVLKGVLQLKLYEEVRKNGQYDQLSSEIRRGQLPKDNTQHSLEQILSFYPCQVNFN